MTKGTEYSWWYDSTKWVKRYINDYEYTNDAIIEIHYYYDNATNEQVKYQKRMLYYNLFWKLTLEKTFDYYAYDNKFHEYERSTYKYDNKNRLIEFANYSNYFYWEIEAKDVYIYNDDSCTMLDIVYNSQNHVLTEFCRFQDKYIYKDNQLESLIKYSVGYLPELDSSVYYVMESYDFNYENGKLMERIDNSGHNYSERIECFYSKKDVVIDIQSVKAYMNANTNEIIILQEGIKRVDIYTINGMLVYSKNSNSNMIYQNLDVSTLRTGVYVVKFINTNGQSYNLKMFKK